MLPPADQPARVLMQAAPYKVRPTAKLTSEQVRRIRLRDDPSWDGYFAALFGVKEKAVGSPRKRRTWRKLA